LLLEAGRGLRRLGYSLTVYPFLWSTAPEYRLKGKAVPAARQRLQAMIAAPRELSRPVLFVHGWLDQSWRFERMADCLRECASNPDGRLHLATMSGSGPIDGLAKRLAEEYASIGELDVVAHSMGNLAIRQAARKYGLRVARLFSLAGPHGGGRCTWPLSVFHPQVRDMASGSPFLAGLNADPVSQDFEIRTWRVAGDTVVSSQSAHLVGTEHRELSPRLFMDSHINIPQDDRVIAEVIDLLLTETSPSRAAGGAQ
jgi:pimeloyl-ACP methyl ester carboxylesterase